MGADHCTLSGVKACQTGGELCSVDLSFSNCAPIKAGNTTCAEEARCNKKTIKGRVTGSIGVNSKFGDFVSGFKLKLDSKETYSFGRVTGGVTKSARKKKEFKSFGFSEKKKKLTPRQARKVARRKAKKAIARAGGKFRPMKGRIVGLKSDSHGRYINYLQFMMVPEKLYQKALK
jgi:hypothetical protein